MKSNGNSPKRSLRETTSENLAYGAEFTEMNTSQRVHQTVSDDQIREDSDGDLSGSQSGDDMKVDGTVASKPKRRAYVDPEVSKERRRERNKLLARKSRQKLKTDMDDLKMKLIYLMKENEYLKRQIEVSVVPPVNLQFLVQRDFALPDSITQLVKELMTRTQKALTPRRMKNSSFCISNAISKDMPLVYASPGFLKLTGYEMHEIIGHNCRFLQGPRTDRNTVTLIKKALVEGRDITAVLLNYRKDGKPFWNQVKMAHLKDQSGRTFLVVGIQTKIRPLPANQIQSQLTLIAQQQRQQMMAHYEEEEENSDDDSDNEDEQQGRVPPSAQQQEQRAMEMAMTGPPPPSSPPTALLRDLDKACVLDSSFEFSFPPLPCDLGEMIMAPRDHAHATVSREEIEGNQQRQQSQGEEVLDAALVQAFGYYAQPSMVSVPAGTPPPLPRQSQAAAVPHLSQSQQQVVQDDHHALLRQSQSYYDGSSHTGAAEGGGGGGGGGSTMAAVGVRRGLGNSSCNDRMTDFDHFRVAVPPSASILSAMSMSSQQLQQGQEHESDSEQEGEFEWGDGDGDGDGLGLGED